MKKVLILPLLALLTLLFMPLGEAQVKKGEEERKGRENNKRRDLKNTFQKLRQELRQARRQGDRKRVRQIQRKMLKLRRQLKGRKERLPPSFYKGLLARPSHLNLRDIAHYGIAQIYIKEKKYDQAILELKRIAQKSPDKETRSAAAFSVGNIYILQRKPQKAVEAYLKVEGRFRKRALVRTMKILRRIKDVERLSQLFEKVIEGCQNPREEAMARLFLANFYRKKKLYHRAVKELRAVTELEYSHLEKKKKKKKKKRLGKKGRQKKGKGDLFRKKPQAKKMGENPSRREPINPFYPRQD